AEGCQFGFHDSRKLSENAQGYTKQFANATVFRFRCTQARQTQNKESNLPYAQTRNRRARKVIFDCHGKISVIFPSSQQSFDACVNFAHSTHGISSVTARNSI